MACSIFVDRSQILKLLDTRVGELELCVHYVEIKESSTMGGMAAELGIVTACSTVMLD
jgi:hypothetical protein